MRSVARQVEVRPPQLGPGGQLPGQVLELGALQRAVARQPERAQHAGRVWGHADTSCGAWASRRPGLTDSIACRAAAPKPSRGGAAYGRSEPWQTTSMPSTRTTASTAMQAVGRRLDEGERVDRAAVAAAGALALAVQRAEAAERDEADRQPRVARAAVGGPRPPGGVELGDVGDDRRPPDRAAGRVGGAGGAGVDEQRPARRLEHVEQRRDVVEAAGGGEHVGGELEPDRAAVQRIAQRRRVGLDGAGASPRRGTGPAARARPRARPRRARRTRPAGAGRARAPRTARRASRRRRRRRAATGSWCAGSTAYGRSPGSSSSQPTSRGGVRRARRASRKGSGQRCWWTSIRVMY